MEQVPVGKSGFVMVFAEGYARGRTDRSEDCVAARTSPSGNVEICAYEYIDERGLQEQMDALAAQLRGVLEEDQATEAGASGIAPRPEGALTTEPLISDSDGAEFESDTAGQANAEDAVSAQLTQKCNEDCALVEYPAAAAAELYPELPERVVRTYLFKKGNAGTRFDFVFAEDAKRTVDALAGNIMPVNR